MAKVFNTFEKAAIKNAAKAVAHYTAKQDKLAAQVLNLQKQMADLENDKKVYEESVQNITGGYSPLDLCERVVRGSGGQGDWVFKYPDTIIPEQLPACDCGADNCECAQINEDTTPIEEVTEEITEENEYNDPLDDLF